MKEAVRGSNTEPTMSSREIADLTGKRHGDVIRDIRAMLHQLGDDADLRHVEAVEDRRGYTAEFLLDRYHTEILVTGYDVKRRAAVIKRWYDLESGIASPAHSQFEVPATYSEALRLAADKAEQVEHLESENDRLNAVCNDLAENLKEGLTPAQFCRQLNGVNTQKVQQLLVAWGRLIATRHGYRAPSQFRDRLFSERHIQKAGATYEKVVLTQKGAKWLYSLYEKGQLPMKQDWDGVYTHMLFEPGQARITSAMEARA